MTHIRSDLTCICSLCSHWPSFSPSATNVGVALIYPDAFAVVAVVALSPPLNNSALALADSLVSQSLQRAARTRLSLWPQQYKTSAPSPSRSSSLSDSYPLFRSNVSPLTTSPTGKQLRNRPLQDFSTGIPCKQLGKKVTSRLRPWPMLAPPG